MRVSFTDAQVSLPRGCLLSPPLCRTESQHENPLAFTPCARKNAGPEPSSTWPPLSGDSLPRPGARRRCPLAVGAADAKEARWGPGSGGAGSRKLRWELSGLQVLHGKYLVWRPYCCRLPFPSLCSSPLEEKKGQ